MFDGKNEGEEGEEGEDSEDELGWGLEIKGFFTSKRDKVKKMLKRNKMTAT